MAWCWCGVFFVWLAFLVCFLFVCFFEKHAVRREKLCCVNSPFPCSLQYFGSRDGSCGGRITSAGNIVRPRESCFYAKLMIQLLFRINCFKSERVTEWQKSCNELFNQQFQKAELGSKYLHSYIYLGCSLTRTEIKFLEQLKASYCHDPFEFCIVLLLGIPFLKKVLQLCWPSSGVCCLDVFFLFCRAFCIGTKNSSLHGLKLGGWKFYLKVSVMEKIWHKLTLKLQLPILSGCFGHALGLGACQSL